MTGACIATHLADDGVDILTKIRSQGLLKITHADGNFGSMSSMTDGQVRGSVGQRSDRGLVIQGDDGLFQLIACPRASNPPIHPTQSSPGQPTAPIDTHG